MAKNKHGAYERFGHWAFLVGAFIAIIAGLLFRKVDSQLIIPVLFLLGVVVGLLNIKAKEITEFLIAAITLLLAAAVANFASIEFVGLYINAILANIVSFVAPAAVIVALKAVWELANR